jgi:hypothetical protein
MTILMLIWWAFVAGCMLAAFIAPMALLVYLFERRSSKGAR